MAGDDAFTFTDKNIFNFPFTNSNPFLHRQSTWTYREVSNIIRWDVFAASGASQSYPDLPAELTSKFPILAPGKLVHEGSLFTVTGETYDDMIDYTFKGKAKLNYEVYRVEVRWQRIPRSVGTVQCKMCSRKLVKQPVTIRVVCFCGWYSVYL